jgi:hypothetical protein
MVMLYAMLRELGNPEDEIDPRDAIGKLASPFWMHRKLLAVF